MTTWDGFYASYMSASDGQGFAMLVLSNGIISGADPLGVEFDGSYKLEEDGSLVGIVTVRVPSGTTVIQGGSTGTNGMIYQVPIAFPVNAFEHDFVKLDTPLGPINMRLKKLRGMDTTQ